MSIYNISLENKIDLDVKLKFMTIFNLGATRREKCESKNEENFPLKFRRLVNDAGSQMM